MITLFLTDGLGNQMFQYAFARSLQLSKRNKLQFVLDFMKNDPSGRKYGLSNFCIDESIQVAKGLKASATTFHFRLLNKMRLLKGSSNSQRYVDKHLICAYSKDVYEYQNYFQYDFVRNVYILGQFQNFSYFREYSDVIKNELKVKIAPSERNQEMLSELSQTNSVCVHIRRGDYLDPKWAHLNVCDYKYYCQAMNLIEKETETPVFYVFSNTHEDVLWIKENLDFSGHNVKYIELNNPDYEEFRLMYSCKHFIISNSTFSWWAQYLGKNENKIVVAPSVWNKENVDFSGIYMPEWRLVEI